MTTQSRQEKVFRFGGADQDAPATGEARADLRRGQVPVELAAAAPSVREALRDGRMALFRVRLFDSQAEDGDVVELSIDGAPIGRFELSHRGADITVPMAAGRQHKLRITAVRDGGGGVSLGMRSSADFCRTDLMAEGQSEEITLWAP